MHHTQALKTLLQCLEDLTGTVDSFGREQNLHDVEKDLVLYRGRLLYEAILKLPTEAAQSPVPVIERAPKADVEPESRPTEPIIEQNPPAEMATEVEPEVVVEEEAAPAEMYVAEPAEMEQEEEIKNVIEVDQLTITLAREEEKNDGDTKPETRIKAIKLERFSIAEVLLQSGDKDLILTHLKLKPIQDLKSGIGLNEKFLFIRELFENDHQAYAQAVDTLNSSENLDEAEAIIANELLPRYGWELEKEALLNFLHLILRRFSNK